MISRNSRPTGPGPRSEADVAWFHVTWDDAPVPDLIEKIAQSSAGRAAATVQDARAASTTCPIAIICPAPAIQIAERLAQGTDVERALSGWMDRMRLRLEQVRPIRRRVVLVEPHALNAHPDDILPVLLHRLGVDMPRDPTPTAARTSAPSTDAIFLGLAYLALGARDDLRDLGDECEAMMLGRPDLPTLSALAESCETLAHDRRILAHVTAERDLLREETRHLMHAMQADAETDTRSGIDTEREHALGRGILQLSARLATQREELTRLKASRSWRYTRPFRR